jgi:hydroxymethylbilane synthase
MIQASRAGLSVELAVIKTTGDKNQVVPLSGMGGKGVFVKEIEEALLEGKVDLAVHSLKDLPAQLPDGLSLAAFPRRAEPWDLLVTTGGTGLDDLPRGARIGTGSLRRRAQLAAHRSDLHFVSQRGNVDTRLRKLEQGNVEAMVLAAAGIERLGLRDKIKAEVIPEDICLPSACQGIIGVEMRDSDEELREVVSSIGDPKATVEACAERGFLSELAGSCLIPAAALARFDGKRVRMRARILSTDGVRCAAAEAEGTAADAFQVGADVARLCLDRGGAEILAELEAAGGEAGPA